MLAGCGPRNLECSPNAECVKPKKKDSEYTCRCKKGYEGDGIVCEGKICKNDSSFETSYNSKYHTIPTFNDPEKDAF